MIADLECYRLTVGSLSPQPEEKNKFDGIFESLAPVKGLLSGEKVRPVLINSKLPLDVLGKVFMVFLITLGCNRLGMGILAKYLNKKVCLVIYYKRQRHKKHCFNFFLFKNNFKNLTVNISKNIYA